MDTLDLFTTSPLPERRSRALPIRGRGNMTQGNLAALQKAAESPERLSSNTLIRDAIKDNLGGVRSERTLKEYEHDLEHFAHFLESAEQTNLYDARQKHVTRFLSHLEKHGGREPHEERKDCSWCRERGYPDGRNGCGWSASSRKGALSAIRFLYSHFFLDEDLPDHDPSIRVVSPRSNSKQLWSPSETEVEKLFSLSGPPRSRLLAFWMFYAPSRRQPFVDALWSDIDLEGRTWRVIGKGGKIDEFRLHPRLVKEFRRYRTWVLKEAEKNPRVKEALEFDESAFVLMTRNGKPIHPNQLSKMLKTHALKAGVGVVRCRPSRDNPKGTTSKVSPHALRRAWARIALNHPKEPVPIDVVSEVLRHEDVSTTRRHYAQTKPERAQDALERLSLS